MDPRIEFRDGRTIKKWRSGHSRCQPAATDLTYRGQRRLASVAALAVKILVWFGDPFAAVVHRHRLVPRPVWASWLFADRFFRRTGTAAPDSRSLDMKLRLLMVVASALLLLAPRTANAMAPDGQPSAAGVSAHELMQ